MLVDLDPLGRLRSPEHLPLRGGLVALLVAGDLVPPEDADEPPRLQSQRLDDVPPVRGQAGRVELQDDEIAVTVGDHAGEAVVLAVHEPVAGGPPDQVVAHADARRTRLRQNAASIASAGSRVRMRTVMAEWGSR